MSIVSLHLEKRPRNIGHFSMFVAYMRRLTVKAFGIFLFAAQKKREKEEAEKKWLEDMSEDEYDALSEQEKIDVGRKRLNQKKEKMKREVEEKLERERKEKEQQALLEEKRLEEERYGKLYGDMWR